MKKAFSMAEYGTEYFAWSKVMVFLRPCFYNLARERTRLNLQRGGSPLRHEFSCLKKKVIIFLRPCFDNLARERIGLNLQKGGSPLRLFVVWHCFNCVYDLYFVDLKQERSKNRIAGKQLKKSSVGSPPWRAGEWGPATPSGAALLFLAQYLYVF